MSWETLHIISVVIILGALGSTSAYRGMTSLVVKKKTRFKFNLRVPGFIWL